MYIVIGIIVFISIFFMILFPLRRRFIIRRINSMTLAEKVRLINSLINPLGYTYNAKCDFFSSTIDAWQRAYGYSSAYDKLAPFFNMIFENLPVYFNYDDRTWLIELWKGQYGINTGSELGIYNIDRIVPPGKYQCTHFKVVSNNEMLDTCTYLIRRKNRHQFACNCEKHWWNTMFKMGMFTRPSELSLCTSITFPNATMMNAFIDALSEIDFEGSYKQVCNNTVKIIFNRQIIRRSIFSRIQRRFVLFVNRFYCFVFNFFTRPFHRSLDRLLFIYFYLPFAFRRTVNLIKCKNGKK